MRKNYSVYLIVLLLNCFASGVFAESKASSNVDKNQKVQQQALETLKSISKGVQALKDDVVTLNKDLRLMEEKLLFPSSTKYSVFVSMNSGQFFTLESVKLKLDGKLVATHLYSEGQRTALARGGIHKLFITNLNKGKHTATAFFTGLGPNGRAYKLAKTLDFEKSDAGEYLELAIRDDGSAQEPVVFLKQW
ncbi:MAG: hypothetical protein OQJ89_14740 [Kangiellaceae bacterium]|nr:hypothetical protein [Kangiellaceae bacterium]MCW8998402.1 hypothetical protein [Kangiellaceae bacterium]MCW9018225.1 hypothetical protein [Kangiellaceae bacterium]